MVHSSLVYSFLPSTVRRNTSSSLRIHTNPLPTAPTPISLTNTANLLIPVSFPSTCKHEDVSSTLDLSQISILPADDLITVLPPTFFTMTNSLTCGLQGKSPFPNHHWPFAILFQIPTPYAIASYKVIMLPRHTQQSSISSQLLRRWAALPKHSLAVVCVNLLPLFISKG